MTQYGHPSSRQEVGKDLVQGAAEGPDVGGGLTDGAVHEEAEEGPYIISLLSVIP